VARRTEENVQPTAPQLTATSTEGAFSCQVDYFWIPRDPPETGGERSDRLLHCEDGAEPGRAIDNALISLRGFGQRVGLDYRFNFSLGYVI